eukprot:GHVL01024148.1.p1 GENE.GHVL01024148.1~~GHVL01024148.1.p1  ORF type:complete len:263 (+),score=31.05 GHVL01024148.1:46-834(+)
MNPDYTQGRGTQEQQGLLAPNSQAQTIATFGDNVEGKMGQMGCGFRTVFAAAAVCTISCAVIGGLTSIASFELPSLVDEIFLGVFGLIILAYNNPCRLQVFHKYQGFVRTYARFLSRVSGQAVFFLFLGAMCITSLWPRGQFTGANLLIFIGLACGLFIVLVAIVGMAIATSKSLKLERVREALQRSYHTNFHQAFQTYCGPPQLGGIGQGDFLRMSSENGGVTWANGDELSLVFNTLCEYQSDVIREHEFSRWMAGSWTMV